MTGEARAQLLWPDAKRGPWIITASWGPVGGRWECVGLEVRSVRGDDETWASHVGTAEGGIPVTAEFVRSLPVGALIADLRRQQIAKNLRVLRRTRKDPEAPSFLVESLAGADEAWSAPIAKTGTMLEEVASVYIAAWKEGVPPTKAVALHFNIGPDAAGKRVWRARDAGLLPATSPGKARGGSS